jgi:hypothetical protein
MSQFNLGDIVQFGPLGGLGVVYGENDEGFVKVVFISPDFTTHRSIWNPSALTLVNRDFDDTPSQP